MKRCYFKTQKEAEEYIKNFGGEMFYIVLKNGY